MIRENSTQDNPDNHKHVNTTKTPTTTTLPNRHNKKTGTRTMVTGVFVTKMSE